MAKSLKVCTNCGKILDSKDFLSNYLYLGVESVLERFTCPKCNYRGPPVVVDGKEYDLNKFPNNPL